MGEDRYTVQYFILAHAVGIPVTSEAYDHQALFLGQDSLVDVPVDGQSFQRKGYGNFVTSLLPGGVEQRNPSFATQQNLKGSRMDDQVEDKDLCEGCRG